MTTNVTGGDLEDLWYVAENALPSVDNIYIEQFGRLAEWGKEPDLDKYGPCHSMWTAVAGELAMAFHKTGESLRATSNALRVAIMEYTYVDGQHATELNELGKELEDEIGDTKPVRYAGEWERFDPYPEITTPEGFFEILRDKD